MNQVHDVDTDIAFSKLDHLSSPASSSVIVIDDDDMELPQQKPKVMENEKIVSAVARQNQRENENKNNTQKHNPNLIQTGSIDLVLAPKVDQKSFLIQNHGSSVDFNGDIGVIGRLLCDRQKISMDLKGILYSCDLQHCNTVMVVSLGEQEARVTSVMHQTITLTESRDHLHGIEKLVHGNLDDEQREEAEINNVHFPELDTDRGKLKEDAKRSDKKPRKKIPFSPKSKETAKDKSSRIAKSRKSPTLASTQTKAIPKKKPTGVIIRSIKGPAKSQTSLTKFGFVTSQQT